jgi:L-alanine-DL-glutamate epimerase-like enolase superfamily enzyme
MKAALEPLKDVVAKVTWDNPSELWEACANHLSTAKFAQCALDQAAHDLWGKRLGQPVYQLWGLRIDANPASNFTIGIANIDTMIEKLKGMAGWPIYKIKLGTDNDLEIVRQLRQHTNAVFRVDANCGWTAETTIANSTALKELGVEFIEQPLPPDDVEGAKTVEEDVAKCHGLFHGINIKLTKCGGLTPARRMIAEARRLGLQVMVGCMTESTVGISAIGQLLPLLDYVDMDGAALLADDIADGVRVEKGICHYPQVNGNGVHLRAPSIAQDA